MILLFLLLQAAPGGEWSTVHSLHGTNPGEHHGETLDWCGDVNSDGAEDFIVGSPHFPINNPNPQVGAAFIYSGETGQLLDSIDASALPYPFSIAWRVSRLGDVTGDGIPEVAIYKQAAGGSGQPHAVLVYSVLPFSLVYEATAPHLESTMGSSGIAGGTDLNGDGWPDLVAGDYSYKESGAWVGAVHALNGLDGSLLWRATGYYVGQSFGQTIACPGDLNGDGLADVLTRSYDGLGGAVHVLSGADGSELYRLQGVHSLSFIGLDRLSGCGDADGDGLPDFIVGQDEVIGFNRGLATIHRGYDGVMIHRWDGPRVGERFGASVGGPGDLNGDGFPDYAVFAPDREPVPGSRGAIYLYSGRDFSPLALLESPASPADAFQFGYPIASGSGDLNGDGAAELLTADFAENHLGVNGVGAFYAVSFNSFIKLNINEISASSGGLMQFQLDFPATESGLGYRLLASDDLPGSLTVHGVKIPLVWTALLQKFVNNPPPVFDYPTGTLDANGDALVTAAIPANALAAYVGRTVKFAAVSLITPSQPSLSSAAAWVEVLP